SEIGMASQVPEGLFGTVGRRGKPVGPQADPGQDGDQSQLVKDGPVFQVAGTTEKPPANLADSTGVLVRMVILHLVDSPKVLPGRRGLQVRPGPELTKPTPGKPWVSDIPANLGRQRR